jgi:hypothetical protein
MTFSDFFDAFGDFDWMAIIAGTLVLWVLAALWYTFLFGKMWARATGRPQQVGMPPVGKVIAVLVTSFVINIGLAFVTVGPDDLEHAIVAGGIVVGVLLIGAVTYGAVLWLDYSPTAWIIDLLYFVVGLSLATWVQGLIVS